MCQLLDFIEEKEGEFVQIFGCLLLFDMRDPLLRDI
jgi:hypothetical protein